MKKPQLTRKERERLRHKKEILQVALNLFSSKGFHNVSMQDIAAESEFAVGTLYNFFESKESLFTTLLELCADQICQSLLPILEADTDEDEKLRQYIRSHTQIVEDSIDFIRLYVSEYGTKVPAQPCINEKTDTVGKILREKVSDIITVGIKKGLFRNVDPEITAHSLLSALESFVIESSGNYERSVFTEAMTKIEYLFIDGLLKPEAD